MADAPQPKPRPVPAPRRNLTKRVPPKPDLPAEWLRLLQSTEVFQHGEVKLQTIPPDVEGAAKEYLRVKEPLQYRHINLKMLMKDNQVLNHTIAIHT